MSPQYTGDVLHAVAIRPRVTGVGNLKSSLHNLDDSSSYNMPDFALSTTSALEPTLLANFQDQRIQVKLETTLFGESVYIARLVIYIKPIAVELPIT